MSEALLSGESCLGSDTLADAVVEFRRTLKADGLWAGMRYLNKLSPYRYSAVFRFEGAMLRNVCLVDREQPDVRECPEMPVTESYCVYVQDAGAEFAVEHARMDCRVLGHPKAGCFQSYYGVPLIADDSRLIGTICHFDERSSGACAQSQRDPQRRSSGSSKRSEVTLDLRCK
jgi:hypothetical protein